jgi:hypothetical protein
MNCKNIIINIARFPRITLPIFTAIVISAPVFGQHALNVKDFGAKGDGRQDDYPAIQKAVDSAIRDPASATSVYFPVGTYRISHPVLLQYVVNSRWKFFSIRLYGETPAKSAPVAYLSSIVCDFKEGFAIGIQFGRGIHIENLRFLGRYTFPATISNKNIGTTPYGAWNNGSVQDGRYAPYAGIVIDPFCDSNQLKAAEGYRFLRDQYLPKTGRGGTSDVEIRQCSVHQFAAGIVLTPNPLTQNDEMINIIDCNIDAVKVAIAIGQDQSKEIHIDRLKCWSSTYTVLDGLHYGRGTGGGSVMINGMNIAGNVNQLFYVRTDRFPLSAKDVFAESLFRIGTVGGAAGASFINFQIDFLTGPGLPAADYLFAGGPAVFNGGMLRFYNGSKTQRMIFNNARVAFRDMTMSTPPIITSIYGHGLATIPGPLFDNVAIQYSRWFGGVIGRDQTYPVPYYFMNGVDPLYHNSVYSFKSRNGSAYRIRETQDYEDLVPIGKANVVIDRNNFTGYFIGHTESLLTGDYILTGDLRPAPTAQVGRITAIAHDTVYLDQVGLNMQSGKYNLFLSVVYYTQDGFLFNCKKGSDKMTSVRTVASGRASCFPGTRFTTGLFPKGAYVLKEDTAAGTITMSAPALETASDASLVNGDPDIFITGGTGPLSYEDSTLHRIYKKQ